MSKCTSKLYDEIIAETDSYRCEYLDILIQKYVKTQDQSVVIHLHNFAVTKSTNYLKRIEEKPFGYVSSYECKTAKKTLNFWKRKIILQKRAAFRKYVGVESSNTNCGKQLKYLSAAKAYKALLSIEKDKLYSEEESESILSNETVLDDDQTSAEENERTLSYEDHSLLPDTEKIAPKKSQNKVFTENEAIKSLETTDKNNQLSANNGQELSNFKVKNCNMNFFNFDNSKQLDILIKKIPSMLNDRCNDKIPKIMYQKLPVYINSIFPTRNEKNSGTSVCSNGASFADYVLSKKFTPKFRFKDIGLEISNKHCQASSGINAISSCSNKSVVFSKLRNWQNRMLKLNNSSQSHKYNSESLTFTSNKTTECNKLRCGEVGMEVSNKNSETSNDCNDKPLFVSNKSPEFSKSSSSQNRIKKYSRISNNCIDKSLSNDSNKSLEGPRLRSREDKITTSNKYCQPLTDCSAKSLLYVSNKAPEFSKLSSSKIRMEKCSGISNNCTAESLFCDSNKSSEAPKLRSREDKIATYNANCQPLSDYSTKSLPCVSSKAPEFSKLSSNEIEKCSGISSNNTDKSLSYVSNKSPENPKLRSREDKITYNKYCQPLSDCSAKPLPYVSNKAPEFSKLNSKKNRIEKCSGISNNCTAKSLPCDSNKSTEAPKLRSKEDKAASNKNCQPLSDCSSNSLPYVSNKSSEFCKFTEIGIESSNKNCESSIAYRVKSLSSSLNKSTQSAKLRSGKDKTTIANKNCQFINDYNAKSVSCASEELSEVPKIKPKENRMVLSNIDCQTSSTCNTKSLIYAPSKTIETPKHKYCETGAGTSKKNCQAVLNSPLSKSASLSSNRDISVQIDPLSFKKGSYNKKPNKKKSSLAGNTLPFQKFLDGAKTDDLSLQKFSTPHKKSKDSHKEACTK